MDELDFEYQETRRCGNCGHFDSLNQCCWVVASDGIFRYRMEDDYCVFDLKEEQDLEESRQ